MINRGAALQRGNGLFCAALQLGAPPMMPNGPMPTAPAGLGVAERLHCGRLAVNLRNCSTVQLRAERKHGTQGLQIGPLRTATMPRRQGLACKHHHRDRPGFGSARMICIHAECTEIWPGPAPDCHRGVCLLGTAHFVRCIDRAAPRSLLHCSCSANSGSTWLH